MRLIIACDMDGTIADWTSAACARVKEIWNLDIVYNDVKHSVFGNIVREKYKEKFNKELDITNKEIYGKICSDDFYLNLEPVNGAIEAIKKIAQNNKIIFVTKPTNWSYSSDHKAKWLEKYFSDIEYGLVMVGSMSDKHFINAHVIIEDDPRAMIDHPTAIPMCISHPWNKEFREKGEMGLSVIEDLGELPDKIEFVTKLLDEDKNENPLI